METNNYYICHHGIKGQKWGVRRYQNEDGSLTSEGKKRLSYRVGEKRLQKRVEYTSKAADKSFVKVGVNAQLRGTQMQRLKQQTQDVLTNDSRVYKIGRATIMQRVAALSAGTISAGAIVYGALALGATPVAALAAVPIGAAAVYYDLTER